MHMAPKELREVCSIGHTCRRPARVRPPARVLAVTCALVLALAGGPRVATAARDTLPRIVWLGGSVAYVALPDSANVGAGMRAHVFDRDDEIAAGEVTDVWDAALARVRVTAGWIDADAKFDKLRLTFEPAAPRALPVLRVGLPAAGRVGLLGPCAETVLDPSVLPRAYVESGGAGDATRLVAADSAGAWPETLLVRRYRDRADEEIALERGELDVAVFWPGEPSARLRAGTGGTLIAARRSRGVLAVTGAPGDTTLAARAAPDLSALAAEIFGGDLAPWPRDSAAAVPSRPGAVRWAVNPALPGVRPIERFLESRRPRGSSAGGPVVTLGMLDAPAAPDDSTRAAWAARGVAPVYRLRCPVACAPARAPLVRALGPGVFADLLRCAGGSAR
jgi:hypothetical protein